MKQIKVCIPSLLFAILIFGCASGDKRKISTENQQEGPKKVDERWSGKYRQITGVHDLIIEEVDSDLIAVDIFLTEKSASRPTSTFLAVTKGDAASMKLLHDDPDCRVELKRQSHGIALSNFCGGTGRDEGFYKRIQ